MSWTMHFDADLVIWRIDEESLNGDPGEYVAEIFKNSYADADEDLRRLANARLIVAAPDMLEFLQDFVTTSKYCDREKAFASARKIITKATKTGYFD